MGYLDIILSFTAHNATSGSLNWIINHESFESLPDHQCVGQLFCNSFCYKSLAVSTRQSDWDIMRSSDISDYQCGFRVKIHTVSDVRLVNQVSQNQDHHHKRSRVGCRAATDHVFGCGCGGDDRTGRSVVAVIRRRQQHRLLVVVLLRQTDATQATHRRAQVTAQTTSPAVKHQWKKCIKCKKWMKIFLTC